MALVVVVVILFLQTWRASVIPIVAIPVSLVGTFAVLAAAGFSLNNLSLFGLVLAVGIVVDDAIVVVENVERNLRRGLTPLDAAHLTMDEVGGALIAIALTLCAVFIPSAFISGIAGLFFRQFAVTIAASTVISCIVSLTLSPALCALLFRPHASHAAARGPTILRPVTAFFGGFNRGFDWLSDRYGRLTGRLARAGVVMLVLYAGLIGLTGFQQKLAGDTTLLIFGASVLFVFPVLAAQYESWTLPLAVVLIVPMCLLAAVSGLLLRGMNVDILAQIGFVVLVGLAAKNAILIVEFAKQTEDTGSSPLQSAMLAARTRLQPILMTSFAFIFGVVPLALATGAGAEMRQSLGTAVLFGMLGVTGFGLLFTPVFYVVLRSVFARKQAAALMIAGTVRPAEQAGGMYVCKTLLPPEQVIRSRSTRNKRSATTACSGNSSQKSW